MTELQQSLEAFKINLCKEIDVGALYTRNPIAHKWKAPWRLMLLRESSAWRIYELLEQSLKLTKESSLLGALLLLRAAFETLAMLVYSSQSMGSVVAGNQEFHEFSNKTTRLVMGSKDKSTRCESLNILSILQKAEKRYPGLLQWYEALSESAHPNYEGMLHGYSSSDEKAYITQFESKWESRYGRRMEESIGTCLAVFVAEYDHEWPNAFSNLEQWMCDNDPMLEATKGAEDA